MIPRRTDYLGRLWTPRDQSLPTSAELIDPLDLEDEDLAPAAPSGNKHFLIIDNRYGTPIHVFLELDPSDEQGFPGFRVRFVTLDCVATPQKQAVPAGVAIGQDPHHLDRFCMFRSDRAVSGAGFILIEPRYVGPNWPAYVLAFRPAGEKPSKRFHAEGQAGKRR
jgi:hypothetical protein